MSLSVETLAVARKYTDDSLAGAGAVAGVPCQIQSKTAITGGTRITFLWVDNNGDSHTTVMDVMNGIDGEDGKGIQSVSVNAENHLIITYSDGTTVDAGQIEIHSAVDSVNGQTGAVVLDAEDVGALPDDTPIPSKTSDLTNDSGFITKVVNDLVNYYLKSETYSKAEVDDIVTAIKNSRFEVVATLPTTDIKTNVIYLVPKSPSQTSNVKDEYINLDGTTAGWEKIGDTEIDLSDYVTTQALNTALADYTTTADLTTLLAAKQDTLTFDNVPTENSNNPVKSGGVYAANQTLTNNVDVLFETGVKNICPPYSGSLSSNGITYKGNSDGTVTVNGTCSANVGANIRVYLKAGQYKVSGCPSGGSYSTYRIGVTTDSWTLIGTHDHGNGTTITIPSDGYYRINLDVRAGYVANNLVFKPMITDVDTPESDYDHYVPYAKTNQELTSDSVTWDDLSKVGAVNFLNHTATNLVQNGITFTVNADRSITANGTATAEEWVKIAQNVAVSESVRASGCPKGGTPSTYFMTFSQGGNSYRDYGDGVIVPSGTIDSVYMVIKPNATVDIVFKPMISPAEYNGPYVPHAMTNKEMTPYVQAISNPNLLDNPWFTVNQRGFSSKNDNGFTVDRWQILQAAGTVSLSNGAITIDPTVSGTTFLWGQTIEDAHSKLAGKTVTLSVMLSDGTIKSKSFDYPTDSPSSRMINNVHLGSTHYFELYEYSSGHARVGYFNDGGAIPSAPITIKAVKLELGSVSTLAMDTVPNYTTELLKCQRYFFRKTVSGGVPIGFGFSTEATTARLAIILPVSMRAIPTVAVDTVGNINIVQNGAVHAASAASVVWMQENICALNLTTTGLQGSNYPLSARDGGVAQIELSADL